MIGDVKVTLVRELAMPIPFDSLLPGYEAAVIDANRQWLEPHFVDAEGNMFLSMHALVVESQGRTIVVDTCVGNRPVPGIEAISNIGNQFIHDLAAAGFPPERVDTVLCTHLHFDHVGWNTMLVDGTWVPTFPKARYLFGRVEYEHWSTQTERADMLPVFADSVRPIFERGLADLVEWDHQICPEIRLMPSTGHTPGHTSVLITSKGQRAMITGDFAHHPCQMAHPEWASTADFDAAAGVATRRRIFSDLAGEPVLVIGTHFAGPTAGHVQREGSNFKLVV